MLEVESLLAFSFRFLMWLPQVGRQLLHRYHTGLGIVTIVLIPPLYMELLGNLHTKDGFGLNMC